MNYLWYMQQLDPHSLFSLFEKGDEEVYKEHGVENTLNNPYVLLNMVTRGIDNYAVMDMLYMKNNPTQYKRVRPSVKYKYFNKLYGYLERLDLKAIEGKLYTIGDSYDVPNLILRLDDLRIFFEEYEQYERCGLIKKTIDVLYEKTVQEIIVDKLFV